MGPVEKLLWCIALPGFGQLLNGKYLKGIVLIVLEVIVNARANLNQIIISSFRGLTQQAVSQANYEWLMFYPCLYMFAIYDAFKDGGGARARYAYLPFATAAFVSTVGLIYSSDLRIWHVLLGPVWCPMLFCFGGLLAGWGLQALVVRLEARRNPGTA
ncbi:hypothetical protein IDH44_12355 [Paenibacillus sp. IB182496]|uniref:Uncharacterized protein n=1 Tax=Paenibacillus sabuli TaxID=2772509 RepID=A0A927GRY8_9BACL|nr:hypothetical protein [Paenibacillus sabuli]MBD2845988.1 hypothetical protein [Paenibacillus sabuli]